MTSQVAHPFAAFVPSPVRVSRRAALAWLLVAAAATFTIVAPSVALALGLVSAPVVVLGCLGRGTRPQWEDPEFVRIMFAVPRAIG